MNWHEYFTYNAETGDLIWKERLGVPSQWNGKWAGKIAGTPRVGRVVVEVNSKPLQAHRIIWEMHHGPIPPKMEIDHINGIPNDNRLRNLRLATPSQNYANKLCHKRTASGLKGVYANKKGWCAKIKAFGKMLHLGTYKTKAEAAVVFAKASLRYYGKFSVFYRSVLANA